ncbi:RnfH family protein [Rhodoferax sp. WC2427]|uniref:RnfH family protein n=1 Tax=Rhodoferax sp. WC2427 TaxID=3234144 RepID=UPI0034654C09
MVDTALHITVVCALAPGQVVEAQVDVSQGACVADALRACSAMPSFAGADLLALDSGVWGALAPHTQLLADGDRLELYRPLTVDPKVARRTRFTRQGAGRAGLFTKKRAGAKAGY